MLYSINMKYFISILVVGLSFHMSFEKYLLVETEGYKTNKLNIYSLC